MLSLGPRIIAFESNVVENMLFIIIRSYRTSQQIDLNLDLLSMGN